MKRFAIAIVLAIAAGTAWAGCTSWFQTTSDGRTVLCTRCCQQGSCNTTCN